MSRTIINCDSLGKSYLIGHQGRRERYTALRDVLAGHARNLWNRTMTSLRGRSDVAGQEIEEFWALREVSFDVKEGDVIGVIGRNGAGKSTLLKVLSRITEPTEGCVTLRGRVASLLEVGTGFHPELTGRENIYLNGAILGMTRADIRRKFDEIVAFAEVEKFLDTPVKRFSSGMYVRLAFAVAAHLEPEILVVDEVLAVGDAEFQKKCLGKMRDVSAGGRTVLFVSHNMAAVQALCPSSLLFDRGRLVARGPSATMIEKYSSELIQSQGSDGYGEDMLGKDLVLQRFEVRPPSVVSGDAASFRITIAANGDTAISALCILIYSMSDVRVAIIELRSGESYRLAAGQSLNVDIASEAVPLVEGDYRLGLFVQSTNTSGDFLDLRRMEVRPSAQAKKVTPFPAAYRGFLELNVDDLRVSYS